MCKSTKKAFKNYQWRKDIKLKVMTLLIFYFNINLEMRHKNGNNHQQKDYILLKAKFQKTWQERTMRLQKEILD